MPQHRRSTVAAALLLLLAVIFGPSLSGAGPSAYAASGVPAFAALPVPGAPAAKAAKAPKASAATAATETGKASGGTCRQQDVPLKGAELAVAHPQPDPLTAPGTTRTPLPRLRAPEATAPRAPPAPVAGCAELLPVLRI
ncbi:hypothetical protein AB0K09_15040 [Streptomyces sp. NPDC049577]|uniref:hypothetical protein n=1 Tax=Streptomyces sp. NPDC049577 TaxID=3155153 RepID=UPI00341AB8C2